MVVSCILKLGIALKPYKPKKIIDLSGQKIKNLDSLVTQRTINNSDTAVLESEVF